MKTLSKDYNHLSGWTLDEKTLETFQESSKVQTGLPLRACGCGVKIDLDHIVYPTLNSLNEIHNDSITNEVIKRRDCFIISNQIKSVTRKVFTSDMTDFQKEISSLFEKSNPQVVVELFSSSFNIYKNFDQLKDQFQSRQEYKFNILMKIKEEMERRNSPFNLSVAKGHSIQGEVDFTMLDFVELGEKTVNNTLLNNDTIITGDSILEPHSLISIFIALNNSLNDLLIYAGNKNICIYPVYDGNDKQIDLFKKGFDQYQKFLSDRGLVITIKDQGPLKVGAHLIGATVISESSNEAPGFEKILPKQKIMLTHFLGDLALLSIHRSQFLENNISEDIAKERIEVLQKLTSPHLLLSRIISEFLPLKGEEFNQDKHLTFISDISGPGLSVLEDAAIASGADLKISTLKFNNEEILNFPRKNYTTSTNGPWVIIANESVLEKIQSRLHKAGFMEAHYIGEILKKSSNPKIYIKRELVEYYSKTNFRFDLFTPQITVQKKEGKEIINCPLFKNTDVI